MLRYKNISQSTLRVWNSTTEVYVSCSSTQGSLMAVQWLLFKASKRTIASPSITCVSCFTCTCVRSHSIAIDRVDVTAMIVVRTLVDIWEHKINGNIRNRCYFMVREWVRFLFTSCEESQTKERDKGEWVSDSSKPESIKIVQRNQHWSNLFIVFVLIDIRKVLLLHYRSRDKINTNTTIAERDIITTSNITYILQRFLKCLNLLSISPRKSENLIFKSYISHNTTSLNVQWECSNTFRTVKTYQVQTCTKFQEKSLN